MDSSESECDDDFDGESGSSCESESNANDSLYITHLFAKKRLAPLICPINWVLLPCLNWGHFYK